MDVLYVVSTPYHLLVAASILYERIETEIPSFLIEGKSLYSYKDSISDFVVPLGGKVNCCNEAGKWNKFWDFCHLIINRLRLHKNAQNNNYQKVYVFSPSLKSALIRQSNPEAEFVLAEEGSGTYSGLIVSRKAYFDSCAQCKDMFSKIICAYFGDSLFYRFSKVMIFRPECVSFNYSIPLSKLNVQDQAIKLYSELIEYRDTVGLLDKRVVFMGQCNSEIGLEDADVIELDELSKLVPDALFKPHPRSRNPKSKLHILDTKSWELSCNLMSNDTVIVSIESSGLTTPKIIFDIEPYIIFTYRLHPEITDAFYASFETSYERAKQIYSDKSRVFAPTSIDEFKSIINRLTE